MAAGTLLTAAPDKPDNPLPIGNVGRADVDAAKNAKAGGGRASGREISSEKPNAGDVRSLRQQFIH